MILREKPFIQFSNIWVVLCPKMVGHPAIHLLASIGIINDTFVT